MFKLIHSFFSFKIFIELRLYVQYCSSCQRYDSKQYKVLAVRNVSFIQGNRIVTDEANHILGAKDTKRDRIKVMVKWCNSQNYKMVPKIPAPGYTLYNNPSSTSPT